MIYLSVIIPCYNEERRLEDNLEKKIAYLNKQVYKWELILVNDGSVDNTQLIIKKFIKNNQNFSIHLLNIKNNQGKGNAVKQGMIASKGKYQLFTDLDNSTSISQINKLLLQVKDNNIVIASRYIQGANIGYKQNFLRRLVSRTGNLFVRLVLGLKYKDTQCGFKLFDRKATNIIFSKLKIKRWGFDLEILSLAKKYHLRVCEVPVVWSDAKDSKLNPIKAATQVFWETLKIKWYMLTNKY